MIEGVKIKRLRYIPDERGFLMEMLRCDDALFGGFGQVYITGCRRGWAKAWHYHKRQTDNFVCVWGRSLIVLFDMRKDSPTYGRIEEFTLEAPSIDGSDKGSREYILLQIPPFVVHGFTAADCDEARIINIPTLPYHYSNPDEFRLPWNSPDVPYTWPEYVKGGG